MSQFDSLKQLQLDYKTTFESEVGQRVLKDLEIKCFGNKVTFDKDHAQHAFNEGARAVLLHLKTMLSLDIEAMEKQQQENEKNG